VRLITGKIVINYLIFNRLTALIFIFFFYIYTKATVTLNVSSVRVLPTEEDFQIKFLKLLLCENGFSLPVYSFSSCLHVCF